VFLAVILLIAVVLRVIDLGHSFWGDEDITVHLVREPLWTLVRHGIPGSESTPPVYYVGEWFWAHIFGFSEFAVRTFTALIGVATVPVAYAIGLELRGRRAGLILAALVAVSPFMVWFSQDARAYGLAVLLIGVGLLFFAQALRTASSRSLWLWGVASAAALATHYFAIFVVVPEAVALLLLRETRSRSVRPIALVAAIWVVLVPLLLFQRSHSGNLSWIKYLGLSERLRMTLQFFVTGSWDVSFAVLAALTVIIAVVIGMAFAAGRMGRRELVILAVGVSSIFLPVAAAVIGFDYVNYQNLVVSWMPFAAVLAVALASWRRVGTVLAVALVGCALAATVKIQTTSTLQRPDWRLASKTLSAQPANTLIAIYPDYDVGALTFYDRNVLVLNPGTALLRPDPNIRVVRTRRIVILAEDPWVNSAANTLALEVPAGFHQTGKKSLSTFVLVTYSAPRAVPVATADLASMRPSGYLLATTPWRTAVFLNRRGASGPPPG
jgi:uncharacterized membrane protein